MSAKVICVVMSSHIIETMGGAQLQAHHFSTYAASKGFRVYYLCPTKTKTKTKINTYEILSTGRRSLAYRWTKAGDIFSLTSLFNRIKPDYIYQRVLSAHTGISALYCLRKKNRCKLIYHIANEKDVNGERTKIGFREVLRILPMVEKLFCRIGILNANYIVAQTHRQDELLKMSFQKSSDLIMSNVFVQALRLGRYKKFSKFTVLWVANLKEQKRPDLALDIADYLKREENIEIIMVGRRHKNDLTYNKFRENVIDRKNVSYLGEKSQEDVEKLMLSSHLFLSTSRIEGYPNTFVQALSYGLPIVSFEVDIDGLIEKNSFGCVGSNVEALGEYIIDFSKRKNDDQSYIEKIQKFAKEEYGLSNFDKLISIACRE